MAKVYHSEIFGLREDKYNWLDKNNIDNVEWEKLEPNSEFYLFIPQDQTLQIIYQSFSKITDIFSVNSVGIVTGRDALTIGFTEDEIWNRVRNFANLDIELARQTYELGKDSRDWKIEYAQKNLLSTGLEKSRLKKIVYRPFDDRYTYYTKQSRGFHMTPRGELMSHMLENNIGLCVGRQFSVIGSGNYDIVFVADNIVDYNLYRRGGELVFPLYIYPESNKSDLFSEHASGEKQPNIKPELFEELKKNFWKSTSSGKKEVTPEEIFYYIYSVLYSNIYRAKYSEFLKIDFPRVPFTKNYKLFIQLGKLGKQLADLHLLKSKVLEKTISKFPVEGNNEVEKPRFESSQRENGKVWINKEQYFDGIKEEVWQYQVGGYQVCEKWLKDRKGRTLTLDEIKTYCKIVTAISKTIELQMEIDKYFEEVETTI